MTSHYRHMTANVIGRQLFDLTNGWNGKPAAGEHVFVAIAAAKEFAGDRGVDVAAGQIGSRGDNFVLRNTS